MVEQGSGTKADDDDDMMKHGRLNFHFFFFGTKALHLINRITVTNAQGVY